MVYKNMILPIIEYGDIFLTGATVDNKRKLQVLQNKGLRCALNLDRNTSTEELHKEAGLMKLKFRREQHLLNYMFDQAMVESNLRTRKRVGVTTRSSKKNLLKTKRPKTDKFKKSLTYCGPKKWNLLPESIQFCSTQEEFKNKIIYCM